MAKLSQKRQRQLEQAQSFAAEVHRIKSRKIVHSQRDVLALGARLPENVIELLHTVIGNVEHRHDAYKDKLHWLSGDVEEQEKQLAKDEHRAYSTQPFQQADDAIHAHGQYLEAIEGARRVLRAFNVYWPAIDDRPSRERDDLLSRVDVISTGGGHWVITFDGSSVSDKFDTSDDAWIALSEDMDVFVKQGAES